MKKKLGLLIFGSVVMTSAFLVSCGDEDVVGTCAGCKADAPWSVFGSEACYESQDDCEVAEGIDCEVCT